MLEYWTRDKKKETGMIPVVFLRRFHLEDVPYSAIDAASQTPNISQFERV